MSLCDGLFRSACGIGFQLEEREIRRGIDLRPVDDHLEVQMRSGRASGRANFGNLLAGHHKIAHLHEYLRCMPVAGDHATAVLDIDGIAVPAVRSRLHHAATGAREDGRAGGGDEVNARMKVQVSRKRVDAVAEWESVSAFRVESIVIILIHEN